MKKISILTIVFLSITALFLFACGSDETKNYYSTTSATSDTNHGIYWDSTLQADVQPTIGLATTTSSGKGTITAGGYTFKDNNGNGLLDKYEDWRLPIADRVADLVSKMSNDEKAGLLIEGTQLGSASNDGLGTIATAVNTAIVTDHIRFGINRWQATCDANGYATYYNNIQELCEAQPLGIPAVICTDPLHGVGLNSTATAYGSSDVLSNWPKPIGFASFADETIAKAVGRIHGAEFRACGIRMLLGPQVDVATEPRWARISDTFGADGYKVGILAKAYIQGLQGANANVNPLTGIAATVKHYPGSGSCENGMDSHSYTGRHSVFRGDNFEYHLNAFKIAFEANPACLMPCYSIFTDANDQSIGGGYKETAHFSQYLMNDILRDKFKWDGMVTSDWNAIESWAWGYEGYDQDMKIGAYAMAGGHQVGSMSPKPSYWTSALAGGSIDQAYLDYAAGKVLEVAFKVGAFENPYSDATAANALLTANNTLARKYMRMDLTLLKNTSSVLPLTSASPNLNGTAGLQIYWDGVDDSAADAAITAIGATKVAAIADADYAIIRVSGRQGMYFGLAGGIPLTNGLVGYVYDYVNDAMTGVELSIVPAGGFPPAYDATYADSVTEQALIDAAIAAKGANTYPKIILCIYAPRPVVVAPFVSSIDTLVLDFGASDDAILDLVLQRNETGVVDTTVLPTGKLPYCLAASEADVQGQLEDLPNDEANKTYAAGAGMTTY